jgi:acyl carrier protein
LTIDTSDAYADITECLVAVIGDEFLVEVDITPETTFSRDIELESIEFIALAERLRQRYEGRVDFTSFIAGLTIDEILGLTVGDLAGHITRSLAGVTGDDIGDDTGGNEPGAGGTNGSDRLAQGG